MKGNELFDMLQEDGHLEEAEASLVIAIALDAIRDCHKQGVIHRDIKVFNILIYF